MEIYDYWCFIVDNSVLKVRFILDVKGRRIDFGGV